MPKFLVYADPFGEAGPKVRRAVEALDSVAAINKVCAAAEARHDRLYVATLVKRPDELVGKP